MSVFVVACWCTIELAITPNGTIYETDDDELVVQGGNVNKTTWHWWCMRMYLNYSNAKTMAYEISNLIRGLTVAGAASSCISVLSSVHPLVAALFKGITVGIGYAKFQLLGLAGDINYYNNGRGVVADLCWILTYDVISQ